MDALRRMKPPELSEYEVSCCKLEWKDLSACRARKTTCYTSNDICVLLYMHMTEPVSPAWCVCVCVVCVCVKGGGGGGGGAESFKHSTWEQFLDAVGI